MTNAEARFNKSHIRKVYACLAVTCHLHFWQNDQDLVCVTAVTLGLIGYCNKESAQILTLEKKILLLLLKDSNLESFDHKSSALTTELPPFPCDIIWAGNGLIPNQHSNRFKVKTAQATSTRFPGSLQVLTSTYKLNLPSKALQVLIFASQSLQI